MLLTNLTSTTALKKLGYMDDQNAVIGNKIAEQVMKAVRDTRELDHYAHSLRLDDSKMLEELDELDRQWSQAEEAEALARTKVQAKAQQKKKSLVKGKSAEEEGFGCSCQEGDLLQARE